MTYVWWPMQQKKKKVNSYGVIRFKLVKCNDNKLSQWSNKWRWGIEESKYKCKYTTVTWYTTTWIPPTSISTTGPATNLGAPSNETNANTQQLQNTQQHEYLRQAFPTIRPAANRVAPSNEGTASNKFHNYSIWIICCFLLFLLFLFFLYYSLLVRHFQCNYKNFSHISLTSVTFAVNVQKFEPLWLH